MKDPPSGSSVASFTAWDVITPPGSFNSTTITQLDSYLKDKYRCQLQSASWNDNTIYADYLTDSDKRRSLSVGDLIRRILAGKRESCRFILNLKSKLQYFYR